MEPQRQQRDDAGKADPNAAAAATQHESTHDTPSNALSDAQLGDLQTGGEPLDAGLAHQFGDRLGADLSGVRVHDDATAAGAAKDVNAHAFAVGNHVHFGEGKYDPGSQDGQRLIGHEIAHTVQTGGAAIPQAKSAVSNPSDAAEQEADRAADSLVGGGSDRISLSATPTASVNRYVIDGQQDVKRGKQVAKDLAKDAELSADVVIQEAQLIAAEPTHSTSNYARFLGHLHDTLEEMEPAARKKLANKIEKVSEAHVLAASKAKTWYSDTDINTVRALVGLGKFSGKAAKETGAPDAFMNAGSAVNALLASIDAAGHQARDSIAALDKDSEGKGEGLFAHQGAVVAQLMHANNLWEKVSSEVSDAEMLAGWKQAIKERVATAMPNIRKLEAKGDVAYATSDLKKASFRLRETFGLTDDDDNIAIDKRKVGEARQKRGYEEGVDETVIGAADKVEDMKDKKTAAKQMLDLLASEMAGQFEQAAAGVRRLVTAAQTSDKPRPKSGWDMFVDLAVNAVTAGIGGALAGMVIKSIEKVASEGLKGALGEMIPALISDTKDNIRDGMNGVSEGSGRAAAFFSKQDEGFIAAAITARTSVIGMGARFLDKDVDHFTATEDLRGLVVDANRARGQMADLQRAVSLSNFSRALAGEKLGLDDKNNPDLEKSATINKRFERVEMWDDKPFTGDTNSVGVSGVLDIKISESDGIIWPNHLKLPGLNDAMRGHLNDYKIGETNLPMVVYGMVGGGRIALGSGDGKTFDSVDADDKAKAWLKKHGSEQRNASGDLEAAGLKAVLENIKTWNFKDWKLSG